ncbi:MAG: YihA family ribosome biogenesis GTP-binding protein [Candidatus Riflebacteria bacterium]|nr:YihA family ribosome biogenesis GTP-binding protein [Candidatus Riflebacteria bacterium]
MTLKITSAVFAACAASKEGMPPPGKPIIALVGRSNVGKSSLVNKLTGRREFAKTSATPGKTLTINYYLINEAFYIVDLPGYGYSKVSRLTKEKVQKMIDDFFATASPVQAIIQIMDVRHPPSTMDIQMYHWINDSGYRYIPILTKIDKLTNNDLTKQIKLISAKLGLSYPLTFSAKSGFGKNELLDALHMALNNLEAPKQSPAQAKQPKKASGQPQPPNQKQNRNPNQNPNQRSNQNQNRTKNTGQPQNQNRPQGQRQSQAKEQNAAPAHEQSQQKPLVAVSGEKSTQSPTQDQPQVQSQAQNQVQNQVQSENQNQKLPQKPTSQGEKGAPVVSPQRNQEVRTNQNQNRNQKQRQNFRTNHTQKPNQMNKANTSQQTGDSASPKAPNAPSQAPNTPSQAPKPAKHFNKNRPRPSNQTNVRN